MADQIREAFPYLRVRDASAAIEFYKQAFGSVEEFRLSEPSGRVGHAELKFGPYTVMISDEYPEYAIFGPAPDRATGSSIHLHVDDVDAVTQRAVSAGAKLTMEPADQFPANVPPKLSTPSAMNGIWARKSRTFRAQKCNADLRRCLRTVDSRQLPQSVTSCEGNRER